MARKSNRQGVAMLRERGHQAYLAGDYDEAIELWQRVGQQIKKMQPRRILADAYFRRGIERIHQQGAVDSGIQDLREALAMYPKTPRYTYHLGLGLHLQGDYEAALRTYRKIRKESPEFADRATYPLALALMQHGDDPSEHPVWEDLTETEQSMLRDVQTFRRRPYQLDETAPPLWHGVVALDQGDWDAAFTHIKTALDTSEVPYTQALAHYYLGNTAAQREDMDTARHHWVKAASLGMDSPLLTLNLGESFYRLAETRLEEGDVSGALDAAQAVTHYGVDTPSFQELYAQVYYHLGHQAANQRRWDEALAHWQQAYDLEDGSFRAAYNLALTYEKLGDDVQAAETWREVLRRRPRKDDHRDAISDEEVAQLWKRAAQAYIKAGEYDEAVHVYRMAVKWNPDNLETRLELVRGLLDNGQLQAAENELARILDRDPDHVPALIQMGEVQSARSRWWEPRNALRYWKRALALEPDNLEAQQMLIDYYLNQAEDSMRWRNIDRAYDILQEALEYQPRNVDLLDLLAHCYVMWDDLDEVQQCVDAILDRPQPTIREHLKCVDIWLAASQLDKASQIVAQAEQKFSAIPSGAYIAIGLYCLDSGQYSMDEGAQLAREWFERAINQSAPGDMTLLELGERLASRTRHFDLAEEYLNRAVEAGQQPGVAYFALAIVSVRQENLREARRYLRKAESLARREKNQQLMEMTLSLRDMMNMPPGFLDMILSGGLPFGLGGPSPFGDF